MVQQEPQKTLRRSAGAAARTSERDLGNLWLARVLKDMEAVQFGDFTIGRSTVNSPVYVNVRQLVSSPTNLRRAAKVMVDETRYELLRLRPKVSPFELVAGVPFGGLHLATAFSLISRVPMIYAYERSAHQGSDHMIEGKFKPGQTVLIIDDLITTGGSVLETASLLEEAGLVVKDAMVLIDRGAGATERLHHHGYNLLSILNLEVMLNYYLTTGRMTEDLHRTCVDYLEANRQHRNNTSPL